MNLQAGDFSALDLSCRVAAGEGDRALGGSDFLEPVRPVGPAMAHRAIDLDPGVEVTSRVFPDLADDISGDTSSTCRVCIICVGGLSSMGGWNDWVRTCIEMARVLAGAGHNLTVAVTAPNGKPLSSSKLKEIEDAVGPGVGVVVIPDPTVPCADGLLGREMSLAYTVNEWLNTASSDFDVVHAPDRCGVLYYSLVSKELGIAHADTHFCTHATSPTLWRCTGNSRPIFSPRFAACGYIERRCVEMADTVISPTQYMLRWMGQHGYELPEGRCFVLPPPCSDTIDAEGGNNSVPIHEIVFLGNREPQHGVFEFVDSIKRAVQQGADLLRITFVGTPVKGFDIHDVIRHQLRDNGIDLDVRMLRCSSFQEIDEFISERPCLVVVPAATENGPWRVVDRLRRKQPMLVTEAPGMLELLREEDHLTSSVRFHPEQIARRIVEITGTQEVPRPGLSYDPATTRDTAICWHKRIANKKPLAGSLLREQQTQSDQPLVTVCVPHYNRPKLVLQTIDSILAQDYPNLEVVLVDDGSKASGVAEALDEIEASFEPRGWKVIRQENLYLGAARNTAVRHAEGKYVFFLDDDNVLKPGAISTLIDVAERNNCDILTSFSDAFRGTAPPEQGDGVAPHRRIIQIGPALCFGLYRNGFGDSNALIRREVFESLGGNTEDYGVGKDDQEFFARAVLSGFRLRHLPKSLYWARQMQTRLRSLHYSKFSAELRVASAYRRFLSPELYWMVILSIGSFDNRSKKLPVFWPFSERQSAAGRHLSWTRRCAIHVAYAQFRMVRWFFAIEAACFERCTRMARRILRSGSNRGRGSKSGL